MYGAVARDGSDIDGDDDVAIVVASAVLILASSLLLCNVALDYWIGLDRIPENDCEADEIDR